MAISEPTPIFQVHRISFTSDRSQFLIAHSEGASVFDVLTLRQSAFIAGLGGVQIAEAEPGTNRTVVVVGTGVPSQSTSQLLDPPGLPANPLSARNLRLLLKPTFDPCSIPDLLTRTTIRGVRLFSRLIAVILESQIRLFDYHSRDMWNSPLRVIDTAINPSGLCAASSFEHGVLAFPVDVPGYVRILRTLDGAPEIEIAALLEDADRTVRCLSLSSNGDRLAVTGDGCVVRVFDTRTRELLFVFYRGKDAAIIHDLAFSADGRCLAASSNQTTIHVFEMSDANKASTAGVLTAATKYIPRLKSMQSVRCFKGFKLPFANVVSALAFINADTSLLAVTHHGIAYRFSLVDERQPEQTVLIPSSTDGGGGLERQPGPAPLQITGDPNDSLAHLDQNQPEL